MSDSICSIGFMSEDKPEEAEEFYRCKRMLVSCWPCPPYVPSPQSIYVLIPLSFTFCIQSDSSGFFFFYCVWLIYSLQLNDAAHWKRELFLEMRRPFIPRLSRLVTEMFSFR